MCVYVRKQIRTSNKSDATSWAATTKSVLITTAIDASEKIYIIFFDTPGALLTEDMGEDVFIVLEGMLANIMREILPSTYRYYVSIGLKGKKILYVQLQKSLYGCLCRAFFFYQKLKGGIKDFFSPTHMLHVSLTSGSTAVK